MENRDMENELLFEMQNSFPMTKKPFEALAKTLNVTEEKILTMIQKLKERVNI